MSRPLGQNLFCMIVDDASYFVKGKIGRCDLPSGPRVYSRTIMAREVKRLSVKIRERWKRGLTDEDPVGVYEDTMTALYEEDLPGLRHDNGMEAIAEACATPEEVKALLRPLMAQAYRRAKKTHMPVRQARNAMWASCNSFLRQHYFVLPQRKKTLERWSKCYLKGYQRWWHRVDEERKRIARRLEKNGQNGNALAEALRRVSPELYKERVS